MYYTPRARVYQVFRRGRVGILSFKPYTRIYLIGRSDDLLDRLAGGESSLHAPC